MACRVARMLPQPAATRTRTGDRLGIQHKPLLLRQRQLRKFALPDRQTVKLCNVLAVGKQLAPAAFHHIVGNARRNGRFILIHQIALLMLHLRTDLRDGQRQILPKTAHQRSLHDAVQRKEQGGCHQHHGQDEPQRHARADFQPFHAFSSRST